MNRFGTPPDDSECVEVEAPSGLILKITNGVISDHVYTMVPALSRKLTPQAVARQLNQYFAFGADRPVKVRVDGYGLFRIGPHGWSVE